MNETKNSLIPFDKKDMLALRSPRSAIEVISKIHSEVHTHLDIDALLKSLNEQVFGNIGKMEPIKYWYVIEPDMEQHPEKSESSRFSRAFAAQSQIDSVYAGAKLKIEAYDLKRLLKKERPFSFEYLHIGISQGLEDEGQTYAFHTYGELEFQRPGRDQTGNWSSKPARPHDMSHGRSLRFPLTSTPSPEEISNSLLQNIFEILEDLSDAGIIPPLTDLEPTAPDAPDTNLPKISSEAS
jgi:hypothetical protein